MADTYNYFTPQQLGDVLARSIDESMKVNVLDRFPFVNMLLAGNISPIVGQSKHEWNSAGCQRYSTTLGSAISGGSATESVTVVSSAGYNTNDKVVVANNTESAMQNLYVTSITNATTMVLSSLNGSDLISAVATGTRIDRMAPYTAYGTDGASKVENDLIYTNNVQQFNTYSNLNDLIKRSNLANGESFEDVLIKKHTAQMKQMLNRQFITGDGVEASGSTGKAAADGLLNFLIDNGSSFYDGDISSAVDDLIDFITKVQKYGGCPMGSSDNVLLVSTEMNAAIFKLQADSGGAVKIFDTQAPISKIAIGGTNFSYIVDSDLDPASDGGAAVALTWRDMAGQNLIKMAQLEPIRMAMVKNELSSEELGAICYATLEVGSPSLHGVFYNDYSQSGPTAI